MRDVVGPGVSALLHRALAVTLALASGGCAEILGLDGDRAGDAATDVGDAARDAGDATTRDADTPDADDDDSENSTPYPTAVLSDEPLAYWRLGEKTETKGAFDATRRQIPGLYANCMLGQLGALKDDPNTAAAFNGTSSSVDVGSAFCFSKNAAFTVEAWIKPNSRTTIFRPAFVSETEGTDVEGYGLILTDTGNVSLERFVSNKKFTATAVDAAVINQYTYVVGTYDGSVLWLYINGSLSASMADSRAASTTCTMAHIGAYAATTSYAGPFDGTIDEVAVYDKALASSHIQLHYVAAIGPDD
jgi:hypothetical protein